METQFQPTGPINAPLMIIGEAPGEKEVEANAPFVGPSGWELDRMLKEAGLSRAQAFVTNVSRIRPTKNDISIWFRTTKLRPKANLKKGEIDGCYDDWQKRGNLWLHPILLEGIDQTIREIELVKPNVIIAFGRIALWALLPECWGVAKWRGSVLSLSTQSHVCKVVPTYHPAAVLRQWPLRRTVIHDLRRVASEVSSPFKACDRRKEYRFILRPSLEQVRDFFYSRSKELGELSSHNKRLRIVADIETRGGHISCLGIGWSARDAICIPFMTKENSQGYWSEEEELEVIQWIRWLLQHPDVDLVGQNWLYDAQYLWRHWKIKVRSVYDTMIGQHTMFSIGQKSLDYLGSLYSSDYVYWKDDGKLWEPSMPEEDHWYYNAEDCTYTWEVDEGQTAARAALAPSWPKLAEITAFQQRQFNPTLNIMNRGIRPVTDKKGEFLMKLLMASDERSQWLTSAVGYPINPKSSTQMIDLFYNQLNQKKIWKRDEKGMHLTCDDAALETIAAREPILRPIIKRIQELRSIGVYMNTFIRMKIDSDGRIRCSFNIAGTKTYRWSSSKNAFGSGTNLQNVPSGQDLDPDETKFTLPNVREMFGIDAGKTGFDIDLDSADLRIVTGESDCKYMQYLFAEGKKPYVEIAKEYYHDPTITKHHPAYKTFKALCHGTNYLGEAVGLARNTGLLVHEVNRIQKWYFGLCPEIARRQEDVKKQVSSRGFVENVFGYRCYFFDRISEDTYKEAVAWGPQSTVGILIDKGLLQIDETLPWCELLLQVHDSLFGQYPSYMGGEAERAIIDACTRELPYATPIVIPVGLKRSTVSWGDCR